MADEKPIVAAEPVVAAAPAPVIVEAAPAPAPGVVAEALVVVEAAPAPIVEAAPAPVVVAEPAVVVAEPAVVAPEKQLNLLAQFDKKTADAAAEKVVEGDKPADGDKPAEVAEPPKEGDKPLEAEKPVEGEKKIEVEAAPVVVEPAKPAPIEYAYTLPETVALPDEMREEFHGIMSEFAATPGAPETQQKLVDFHLARLGDGIAEYNRTMRKSWDDMNEGWAKEVQTDPVMGGNAIDSTLQAVAYVRDNFVSLEDRGTPAYQKAKADLDSMMELTGAGNHPAFIRLMHNISQVLNEPQMVGTSDIKPIPQQDGNGRPPIYRTSISQRNGR